MKKTLYKEIKRSITTSKGRFLSIAALMALGAFGLTGLKSTGPDIDATVQHYTNKTRLANLFVLGNYGLDKTDEADLLTLPNTTVELGYFTDTVIENTSSAIRVFSQTQTLSLPEVLSGRLPQHENEVVLSRTLQQKYKIGDEITLKEKDTKKVLKTNTFIVTGFIHSSEYISETNLGMSNLGSGTLTGVAFVTPSTFDSPVYTIARIGINGLTEQTFSQAYIDKVDMYQKQIDERLADNPNRRLVIIKSEAQTKIDEGLNAVQNAEQQLQDGQKQLDTAYQAIADNKKLLEKNQTELLANERQLQHGKVRLDEAHQTLTQTKKELDEAEKQIEIGQEKLDTSKAELEMTGKTLQQVKLTLEATKRYLEELERELNSSAQQLTARHTALTAKKDDMLTQEWQWHQDKSLLQTQPELANQKGITPETLAQRKAQLDYEKEQIAEQEREFNAQRLAYEERAAELPLHKQAYQQGVEKYQQNYTMYDTGMTVYQTAVVAFQQKKQAYLEGLHQYQEGVVTYEEQQRSYVDGVNQLEDGREKLEKGFTELSTAQTKWQKENENFQRQKSEADKTIANQKRKILDAQEELAGLNPPTYTTYTRSTMLGGEGFSVIGSTSRGITAVSNLFPVVLYAVAALVTLTTMTRFVSEERTNSGLLKALGYQQQDVLKKFIIYGLVAGITGTIIGTLAGVYLLPPALGVTLLSNTILPPIHLIADVSIISLTLLCSLFCTLVPAILVARKELREQTATLLLPKAPVSGAKIMLEHIAFIWKRLSFTQKVTARNIFRYKLRMFMTIFGVAGSITLLFAGLGIISSLSGISKRQYGDIIQYHALLVKQHNISNDESKTLDRALSGPNIVSSLPIYVENFTKKIPHVNDVQTISLFASSSPFNGYITLFDKDTKKILSLTDDGVIINEKLAKLLHLSTGDNLVLEKENKSYSLKISGIAEMYAGHSVYMTPTVYQKVFNQNIAENAHLIKLADTSNDNILNTTSDLILLSGTKNVIQNTTTITQINTLVNSLSQVMTILVIVSILLVVVILYNLNNINVNERIRELSTIKVLGFYNHEVTRYIYRETIILSAIGIGIGLFGGRILHRLIIKLVETPIIMFNPNVELWVYVVPTLIVVTILAILGFIINRILSRINMLDALKSVD